LLSLMLFQTCMTNVVHKSWKKKKKKIICPNAFRTLTVWTNNSWNAFQNDVI